MLLLLLLGIVIFFAYYLFLNLVLILFPAFVSHCVSPFYSLFTVLPNATACYPEQYILGFKAIPGTAEGQTGNHGLPAARSGLIRKIDRARARPRVPGVVIRGPDVK